jgi:glucose/arabinose dehydrogenase
LRDGSVVNALATTQAPVDLNDGQLHTAWIDYDGLTDILNVYVGDGTKPAQALLSTTIDLTTVLGNQAYMGFTAGSGFIGARQEISNWSFQAPNVRASAPLPPTPTANVNLATLSPALISLNGAANRAATAIELTPDRQHSRGSAFYNAPVQIGPNTGFNTQFQFVLDGAAGTTGADGFTFALQNSSAGSQALGAVGSYVGIGLVEKSLAVKFDTYKNANDVAENTVAIVLNGEVYAPIALQALPFDLNNGAAYSAWVDYDGLTDQLTVYVSDGTAKPAVAVLTTTIDLTTVVGEQAYVGFTAAAGGIAQRQTVTGWQFQTGNGVAQPPVGTGDGLRGEYFDNANFTNLRVVRVDPTVNYNWAGGSPEPAIGPDTFSVRWSGQVQAQYDEAYTFYTTTDDGVRLTVNGQVLINQLAVQGGPAENLGTITLAAGQRYDIVLEYLEDDLEAQAQLAWSSASQVRQVIPQSQLYTVPYNPGTIFMGSENFAIQENSQFATVRFVREGGSDGYATVNFTTVNASALAGQDYTTVLDNVTFAPGEIEKLVQIPILNDGVVETNEVFNVALGETAGAGLGTRRTVGVTILDDDAVNSVFNFSRATYTVNENAGTASITIERSGDTTIPATINYTTTNGTATAGADYTTTTGTLAFAANEVTKVLLIPITNDATAEPNENLTITLSAPTGGALGLTTLATLTIADNDTNGTFTKEVLVPNLVEPTAFEFAPVPPAGEPQLMFIAEKRGTVRVMRDGVLQGGNFIDISDEVNNTRDRGLIGIAVHPQFYAGAPYIYLSYTYDPPEAALGNGDAGRDGKGNRPSRMIRVEAEINPATGAVTAKAGTQLVLLGKNSTWANTSRPDLNSTSDFTVPSSGGTPGNWVQDYLATDSESHSIGDVAFGPDGFLYVSNGDGTSYNDVDPRAARVMDIDNLSGKMLRLDPLTGQGVADNPFWDGNGDSNRSKVWNLGLRNPFRFTFDDVTGLPVIADVGWSTWEEVNIGTKGANFGWPWFEGGLDGTVSISRRSPYENAASTAAAAAAFYNSGTVVTAPAFSYLHDGPNAIVAGDFYDGPAPDFQGGLFTADASRGTIDVVFYNDARTAFDPTKTRRFETNLFGVTQMQQGPDGSMYFVTLGFGGTPGTLQRWTYA